MEYTFEEQAKELIDLWSSREKAEWHWMTRVLNNIEIYVCVIFYRTIDDYWDEQEYTEAFVKDSKEECDKRFLDEKKANESTQAYMVKKFYRNKGKRIKTI